jgi:polyhydroxyalkanoate synthesis regulator protein
MPMLKSEEPIIIKKFANRRLFNSSTGTYVSMKKLAGTVRQAGVSLSMSQIHNANTSEDITRQSSR